jgi:hypothetical protein
MSHCSECLEPAPEKMQLLQLLQPLQPLYDEPPADESTYCCGQCTNLIQLRLQLAEDNPAWGATLDTLTKQNPNECVVERTQRLFNRMGKIDANQIYMMCTINRLLRATPPSTTIRQFLQNVVAELEKQQQERITCSAAQ